MKAVTNKIETWVDGEGGGCSVHKIIYVKNTHSWSLMLEWDIYTMI